MGIIVWAMNECGEFNEKEVFDSKLVRLPKATHVRPVRLFSFKIYRSLHRSKLAIKANWTQSIA